MKDDCFELLNKRNAKLKESRQIMPSDIRAEIEELAKQRAYAFEKDFMDGAHTLYILLRNKGLLKH